MERSVKTFMYNHEGSTYVGQGLDEFKIRTALETRHGLPHGVLKPGKKAPSFRSIKTRLRLPESMEVSSRTTIGQILKAAKFDEGQVIGVICDELLIPRGEERNLYENTPISYMLSEYFFKAIDVKLHKIVKKTVHQGRQRVNVVVESICRVEDTVRLIDMLHKQDYNLIVELGNYQEELDKMNSSIKKSKLALTNHLSNADRLKHSSNIEKLTPIIERYSESLRKLETRNTNTGYLVSYTNEYDALNYEEWKKVFHDAYEKLRKRVVFMCISDIEYKNGITVLEYLDSYWLSETENNKYANTL